MSKSTNNNKKTKNKKINDNVIIKLPDYFQLNKANKEYYKNLDDILKARENNKKYMDIKNQLNSNNDKFNYRNELNRLQTEIRSGSLNSVVLKNYNKRIKELKNLLK